ncbi:uncharacterized protein LOC143252257 isoform X1 [Tachypleus tridentatus]|uniref:uncharacterized protein LOC143252257 isoform X1 n=2 Tax=Tachypleus tridentatus TaxID=6853 RepID=UPI003FD359EA
MGIEVQPVPCFVLDNKKTQTLDVDEDNMLCDSQARGVKRKYEDGKECETPTSLYITQRQSVFNISVCKLNRLRQTLSLRRSVLIYNTLREIQRECEQEGIKMNYAPNNHLFLAPLNPQVMTLDPPPVPSQTTFEGYSGNTFNSAVDSKPIQRCLSDTEQPNPDADSSYPLKSLLNTYQYKSPSQAEERLNHKSQTSSVENSYASKSCTLAEGVYKQNGDDLSEEYDRYLMEFDSASGRITPFVKTACDRLDSGALWNDDSDRLTSLNWSSVLNFSSLSTNTATSVLPPEPAFDSSGDCQFAERNRSSSAADSVAETVQTPSESSSNPETSLHVLLPATSSPTSELPTLNFRYTTSSPSPTPGATSSSSSGDEIFGDIDMALYDFDLYSPLSPPNVKLAPVSAEELMTSLTENGQPYPVSSYLKEKLSEDEEQSTPVES